MSSGCAIQNFTTASCVSGKFPLYNEFRDYYLKPDIRKEAVIRGDMPSLTALLIDMRRIMMNDGNGYRKVRTRKYLQQEICSNNLQYNFTTLDTAQKTITSDTVLTVAANYSSDGTYSLPNASTTAGFEGRHRATANIGGTVYTIWIDAVTKSSANAHTITVDSINGQSIVIPANTRVKWQYDPAIMYEKSSTSCIATEGFAQTAPNIIQGNIQKFEKGLCIYDDEIDNYAFDTVPDKMQVWDSLTNSYVDTWCLPPVKMAQIKNELMYSELYNFLFGEYDANKDLGINGILPTASARGNFNMPINTMDKSSFLATLKIIAKQYTRQGIKAAMVFVDQEMAMNIDDMLANTVGYNNFNLPVFGGNAFGGQLDWYNFKGIRNIFGLGFDIQFVPLTGWEQLGYDSLYSNWGFVMPVTKFYDSAGNAVSPMEIVKLDYCDGTQFGSKNGADGMSIWYDDTRERGCRKINFYGKNSFGLDIHCAQNLGILSGGRKATF